jgi:hypothetical protein
VAGGGETETLRCLFHWRRSISNSARPTDAKLMVTLVKLATSDLVGSVRTCAANLCVDE